MLYWWHLYRDCGEVAGDWDDRGDFWFPEPLRVRLSALRFSPALPDSDAIRLNRDFFPVIITFLRQLPFIGHFLTLPYISTVIDVTFLSRTRVLMFSYRWLIVWQDHELQLYSEHVNAFIRNLASAMIHYAHVCQDLWMSLPAHFSVTPSPCCHSP
jgi:hypothetical protein